MSDLCNDGVLLEFLDRCGVAPDRLGDLAALGYRFEWHCVPPFRDAGTI